MLMHFTASMIQVPKDDPFYSRFSVKCLNFIRAAPVPPWDCAVGTREQMNSQTSFIDLSSMYGSDQDRVDSLRLFRGGLLSQSFLFHNQRPYPMMYKDVKECELPASSPYSCFKSGDDRGNMHIQLSALHVVYLRMHNQIAKGLANLNPHWNDERLFQESRRLLSAMQQHITYGEHLPLLIGPQAMKEYDLYPLKEGFYHKYSFYVHSGAGLAASTAAYRLHNQIIGSIDLYKSSAVKSGGGVDGGVSSGSGSGTGTASDNTMAASATSSSSSRTFGTTIPMKRGHVLMNNTFFDPRFLQSKSSNLNGFLNGMMMQPMGKADRFMDPSVTRHLFHANGSGYGGDLAAIDIQRGRDVGLSGFNSWVQFCSQTKYVSIEDMSRNGDFDRDFVDRLKELFVNVDDIDFWSAGLNEKPVEGGAVGPTFACVIAHQFARLKQGDRFWYENPMPSTAFSLSQLQQIRKITMARLMCDGAAEHDAVSMVPLHAFLLPSSQDNPLTSCSDTQQIPAIDLTAWKEDTLTPALPTTSNLLAILFP